VLVERKYVLNLMKIQVEYDGFCEVNTDKLCVWVRVYKRMKKHGETDKLTREFVPPWLWELKDTSSWINFHLDRDHQKPPKPPARML
jgi:methylenetetrahydrofolate reductase (NADPH)